MQLWLDGTHNKWWNFKYQTVSNCKIQSKTKGFKVQILFGYFLHFPFFFLQKNPIIWNNVGPSVKQKRNNFTHKCVQNFHLDFLFYKAKENCAFLELVIKIQKFPQSPDSIICYRLKAHFHICLVLAKVYWCWSLCSVSVICWPGRCVFYSSLSVLTASVTNCSRAM